MSRLVDVWPTLLSCRQIDAVEPQLAAALGLSSFARSIAIVTCDQDDALYVALDEATKHAAVDVMLGQSFYAGSKHSSGPFSGEAIGVLAGSNSDDVSEAVWALRAALRVVRFQTFTGDAVGAQGHPAFLAHVVERSGNFLAPQAQVEPGAPIAYLIAPPAEAVVAIDAALKAAPVQLAKWMKPPSETNFAGAYLTGDLAALGAARDAFVDAIADFCAQPLRAARRPDRLRR